MEWVRSTRCGSNACVEVSFDRRRVYVRDNMHIGHLTYTHAEWRAFLEGVRAGEFDVPDEGT